MTINSRNRQFRSAYPLFSMLCCLFLTVQASAVSKVTISSGDWSNPVIWSPSGTPVSGDDVTISSTHVVNISSDQNVKNVTVSLNATLIWTPGKRLTISGTFTVNGLATMNGGLITIAVAGQPFILGAGSVFTWDPGFNTAAEATLFTKGAENFSPTCTLIIKNWFNYSTALGTYVTGNFGNLTLNSPGLSNTIVEWNQKNQFQTHKVLGCLTIDQGWITLDKSGSISVTSIGSIVLTGMNSTLYGHNGTHPSSFSIVTTSITNNGGNFYGLNDGNGNVTIHVISNFTNLGNVKIINNSGVAGVSNGNATFIVDGTFTQLTGDTRIIYNISTNNSGIFTAVFGNLITSGGIFMAQTGCHSAGGTCTLTVNNNLSVNFLSPLDKFRAASVTSIGTFVNNAQIIFQVGGNVSLSGLSTAEFTTSCSSGIEQFTVAGDFIQNGITCSLNYGTIAASHTVTANLNTVTISGGTCYWSRNNNSGTLLINSTLKINGGTTVLKGGTGVLSANINGSMTMNGGNLLLHSNTGIPTPDPVIVNLNGTLIHSGGTINFDNNNSISSASHQLILNGDSCLYNGPGVITCALAGTGTIFGTISYAKAGTMYFSRSATHLIEQTIQSIDNGCEVNVISGSVQVSSNAGSNFIELIIKTGGTLALNNGQIQSNAQSVYCNLRADSSSTIKTYKQQGFYDGTIYAAVNSSGNMNYYLDPNSVIEQNGWTDQLVTGLSGSYNLNQHKYGILRINLQGNSTTSANLSLSQTFVRTGLELNKGELKLNGHTLIIENGLGTAIKRQIGFIKSESSLPTNTSTINWQQIAPGIHTVPFGLSSTVYLPVTINPLSGYGNTITISTRATGPDNSPYPPSINFISTPYTTDNIIDRWWYINGNGINADLTLTYLSSENTLPSPSSTGQISILPYSNSGWGMPSNNSSPGQLSGTGTVTAYNQNLNSHFLIVSSTIPLPITLISFNAAIENGVVKLNWITSTEINNNYFSIEKSTDGITFHSIGVEQGAGNSTSERRYEFTDPNLWSGKSFYRLQQIDYDSRYSYSDTQIVINRGKGGQENEIISVMPNPFRSELYITYSSTSQATFSLYSQLGQKVYESEQDPMAGEQNLIINRLEDLASGIYFLNMSIDGKKFTRKIIKQ